MTLLIVLLVLLLVVISVISILFIRYKKKTDELIKNRELLDPWLEVQQSLNAAGGALLIIKKVDPSTVYFREPPR